jgi:hypothetical protein
VKSIAIRLIAAGRTLGPYLAIELLLPGGSLVALLLCLYRTSHKASRHCGRVLEQPLEMGRVVIDGRLCPSQAIFV